MITSMFRMTQEQIEDCVVSSISQDGLRAYAGTSFEPMRVLAYWRKSDQKSFVCVGSCKQEDGQRWINGEDVEMLN